MVHTDQIGYERQQSLIAALIAGGGFPQIMHDVQIVETHISWVLIAGQYAYKIKKALNLGFLDFTSLQQRKFYCDEEIRLNSRLASEIYLDVIPIGGSLFNPIVNAQPAIEYAVRMHNFNQENILVYLLERGEISPMLMNTLAVSLADFHECLPPADNASLYATPKLIHDSIKQNYEQLLALLSDHSDRDSIIKIWQATFIEFNRCKNIIQTRHVQGYTRECHGDLHSGNIVLINGRLVPFDGIEFNPDLRWIDVIDEVAFLVMDLLHGKRADMAFRFLNHYFEVTGNYEGVSVLRFYIAYRAEVRAKVFALRASQQNEFNSIQQAVTTCRSYLALAADNLKQPLPALIITHGLPGSGKTTISQAALERFQAVRIRSDVERKRLFGLSPSQNSRPRYSKEIYSAENSRQTYQRLLELASLILAAGYSVIVDASFLIQDDRERFRCLALNMAVPFVIMSVTASDAKLQSRILHRQSRADDASDADLGVLALLKNSQNALLPHELVRTVKFLNEHDNDDLAEDDLAWNRMERLLLA